MMMKKTIALAVSLVLLVPVATIAQDKLPVPNSPSSWVNDYANVFSAAEVSQLERKLNEFEYRTSTQIYVITLDDNGGYPVSMLTPLIGERWGVGQKGKDNGLLVVLDMQDRDVFISTGYGVEEYIPDAIAKRIVESEIVPNFKTGNFYGGIDAATDVMISLLDGKFTADAYRKQTASRGGSSIGGVLFMIILFSIIFGGRRRSSGMGGRRSNLPLWMALGMMSGGRHSGSFGNFNSGGGGFGGFGGGGGGSFGGGGAGGSW